MISIERQPWREMVNHAQATYPNECCGAMIGTIDGDTKTVAHAMALDNASAGPQAARYELRPEDLLRADREGIGFALILLYSMLCLRFLGHAYTRARKKGIIIRLSE